MVGVVQVLPGYHGEELLLHFGGRIGGERYETDPPGDPVDVGVHGDGRLFEEYAEEDIGGLPADPR